MFKLKLKNSSCMRTISWPLSRHTSSFRGQHPYLTNIQPTLNAASDESLLFLTKLPSPQLPKSSHGLILRTVSHSCQYSLCCTWFRLCEHAFHLNWERLQSDICTLFLSPCWLASLGSKQGFGTYLLNTRAEALFQILSYTVLICEGRLKEPSQGFK